MKKVIVMLVLALGAASAVGCGSSATTAAPAKTSPASTK